jgi:hypothetical protein
MRSCPDARGVYHPGQAVREFRHFLQSAVQPAVQLLVQKATSEVHEACCARSCAVSGAVELRFPQFFERRPLSQAKTPEGCLRINPAGHGGLGVSVRGASCVFSCALLCCAVVREEQQHERDSLAVGLSCGGELDRHVAQQKTLRGADCSACSSYLETSPELS